MKILFVLEYYHPHIGGVESLFKSLIDTLTEQGHEVIILTNRYDSNLISHEVGHNLSIRRYRFFNRYIFTFLAWLPGLFITKGVDIIHTTSYNAAIPAWIIGKLTIKKVVVTFHEFWGNLWYELPWMIHPARWLHFSFEKMLTKLSFEKIVAVSDFTKEALMNAHVDPQKVVRIYNGIDYEEHRGMHIQTTPSELPSPFVFTYFGRIGYSKGLDLLIEAVASLRDHNENFILQLIVPKEHLFENLLNLIQEFRLENRVRFFHSLPKADLFDKIANSDAVVIPSYSEGFCFAAVETMTIGTPIVSSGRGALKEVISGQFIEMDSFSSIALKNAMIGAMQGRWTKTELKKFPLHHTVDQYIDLYQEMIQTN